jgi:hypothetical protein
MSVVSDISFFDGSEGFDLPSTRLIHNDKTEDANYKTQEDKEWVYFDYGSANSGEDPDSGSLVRGQ